MKKITALLIILGGSVAFASAQAASTMTAANHALPVVKTADQNANSDDSSVANQDLAQANDQSADQATAGDDQTADNSDIDNTDSDGMAAGTDSNSDADTN